MADLIDRQAAIDILMKEWKAYKDYPYVSHVRHGLEIAIAILENKLPSAQAELSQVARDIATIIENEKDMRVIASAQSERKQGEWLDNETSYSDDVPQTCTCSVCRLRSRRPVGDFCKWCGADMRGEQDG